MLKTVSSIVNAIGALNYKGTWNASTNMPTLASGVGTKGDYYQVNVAGATALDGISNWGVGDVAAFNGTTWQRIEGGADLNGVNLSVSGTSTLSALTASTALALNASKEIVSVTNTGSGNNVLSATPVITNHRVTNINDIFLDGSHTGALIANGATIDFPTFSGILFVTDWAAGTTGIWLCGGGGVASLSAAVGSLAYNGGINGYTWTNNTGGDRVFGFVNFKTRNGA